MTMVYSKPFVTPQAFYFSSGINFLYPEKIFHFYDLKDLTSTVCYCMYPSFCVGR
jgi:hypothetical protein